MASISSRNLIDAVLRVERMTFKDRERLAEEVHARQPNLFFSVLVLQRDGASLGQIEEVLQVRGSGIAPMQRRRPGCQGEASRRAD
jgi:hypothetical protein